MRLHTVPRRWGLAAALTASSVLVLPTAAQSAPPGNDDFGAATPIATLPFTTSTDLTEATTQAGEPFSCVPAAGTVWYRVDVAQAQPLRITLDNPTFGYVADIYRDTGGGLGGLAPTGGCTFGGSVSLSMAAGEALYVRITRFITDPTLPPVRLDVALIEAPANDGFAGATAITTLPFTDTLDTSAATVEAGEPSLCTPPPSENTVWYAYTATSNGSVTARSWNAVAAYTGSTLADLTQLDCRYNGAVTLAVVAGTTYFFQVGRAGQSGGPLTFDLDVAPAPSADFAFAPSDPSTSTATQFIPNAFDPAGRPFTTAWDFGDGSTSSENSPAHRYSADGTYTVTLTVTTDDGRTATATRTLTVRTLDVEITQFDVPASVRAGRTRSVTVGVSNTSATTSVEVVLFKSEPSGAFVPVGSVRQSVPARSSRKPTLFSIDYTFTSDDAAATKLTFRAEATPTGRDAAPADNAIIAFPTRVNP